MPYGLRSPRGVKADYGIRPTYGVLPEYGAEDGILVSALFSTLTSSAASFTAGGAGVTLTFTAKDADDNPVEGYTPAPEAGVV